MALYRFEAKIVSRAGGKRSSVGAAAYRTGKCATASAAYRAGAVLVDERTGLRFDYSRMRGVRGADIMAPDDAPDWMRDRSQLWNTVERIEKRHDAQLARDFVISLPHELPHEERVELTREFVQKHFVDRGLVADVAWHAPERGGDPRNFHAHVMVVMRRVEGDGFAKKKDRPPEGRHPAKQWKIELEALRLAWADHGADALARAGLDLEAKRFRAGHLTLDKQREAALGRGDLEWADALDREAEPKQGPLATKIEKEGRESLAGNDRRNVKKRNAELAALKAEQAAVTAEIIHLEIERLKRGIMDELTDEMMAQQPEREAGLLDQAKAKEAEVAAFKKRVEQEAAEAKRGEEERKRAEAVRAKEGEITDPKARYAEALGNSYNARDPYGSLANAAMAEYAAFNKQQQDYRKQEAAEQNPEKRHLIQLAREIEAHDYMAITSERLSSISRYVAGPEAEKRAREEGRLTQAEIDKARGEAHRDRATELREQRRDLIHARETRQADGAKQQPTKDRVASGAEQQTREQGVEHKVTDQQRANESLDRKDRAGDGRGSDATGQRSSRLGKLTGVSEAYDKQNADRATRPRGGRSR